MNTDTVDTTALFNSLAELMHRGVIEVFSCALDSDRLTVIEASSADGEAWGISEVEDGLGGYTFETWATSCGFADRMARGLKGF